MSSNNQPPSPTPDLDALADRVHYLSKWFVIFASLTALFAAGIVYLSCIWRQGGHDIHWLKMWHDWQSWEQNRKSARDQLISWGAFVPALLALPALNLGSSGDESIAQRASQILMQRVVALTCGAIATGALILIPTKGDLTDVSDNHKAPFYPSGSLALCIFAWLLNSALLAGLGTPAGQRSRQVDRTSKRVQAIQGELAGNSTGDVTSIRASLNYAKYYLKWQTKVLTALVFLPILLSIGAWRKPSTYLVMALLLVSIFVAITTSTAISRQRKWRRAYDGRASGVMNYLLFAGPASLVFLFSVTLPSYQHGPIGLVYSLTWFALCRPIYTKLIKIFPPNYDNARIYVLSKDLHLAEQSLEFLEGQQVIESPQGQHQHGGNVSHA